VEGSGEEMRRGGGCMRQVEHEGDAEEGVCVCGYSRSRGVDCVYVRPERVFVQYASAVNAGIDLEKARGEYGT
jgi:hypothetical protein